MACCHCESAASPLRSTALRRVLWAVLLINLGIFAAEYGIGWFAESTALQADSLDSLADAMVYALSLWVMAASLRARAGAALVKGAVQLAFGLAVLAEVVHRAWGGAQPQAPWMAWAAAGALLANGVCLFLLTRFRHQDINLRSVWLCSRNDVIGNAGVLLTAALVGCTGWGWLDLLFGAAMAVLFLRTAAGVMAQAWPQYRSPLAS